MAKKTASKRKTREPKKILNLNGVKPHSEMPAIMTVKPDSRKNDAVTAPNGVDGAEAAAVSLKDWGKTVHEDRERAQRLSGCGTGGILCDECVEKRNDARAILAVVTASLDVLMSKEGKKRLSALPIDDHVRLVADLLTRCRDMVGRGHE